MNGRTIVVVLIAALLAVVLLGPIATVVSENTGETDVQNESWVATVGETEDLDGYNVVSGSETVERYNTTSGSWETLSSGTDYEISYEPGEVTILSGGAVSDGDDVRASYSYEATDSMTTTVVTLVPLLLALLVLVVLAKPIMEAM